MAKKFLFEKEDEMISVLKNMDETDIKSVNYIDEASLTLITDVCPVLTASAVMAAFGINDTVENEQAVDEAVAPSGTGCIWKGPVNGNIQAVPVSDVALPSLCGRAGLYGPSIKIKPTILNEGFVLHSRTEENKTKTLIRDGRLIASHSNKYQWLPQGELVETNRVVFSDLFGDYQFEKGEYTDEITYAVYSFPDQKKALTAKYNKSLRQAGQQEVTPAVLFSTSDVTKSGANLYPMMVRADGSRIRLGSSIKLSHDSSHTVADYVDNCYQVLSMLQDSTRQMEKLMDVKLLYPENAFQNAVKKYALPVGAANKAYEDFTIRRGAEVTASDLYWSLWNLTGYLGNVSAAKMLDVEEQLAKLIFADWKKLDTPICD